MNEIELEENFVVDREQEIEDYREILERSKEDFTRKCSLIGRSKFFKKIFSIAFFYKSNTKKSTKLFAYIAGIIESITNVEKIINKNRYGGDRYGVHVYVNGLLLEMAKLSPYSVYEPLSYTKDSNYDMINKLILFLKDREIVNVIVYDCSKYTNKGLFGTVTRFFPFFTDNLEEIHVRDTDSCFGSEFDLRCIEDWKKTGKDYYYYASYKPRHVEKWASDYGIKEDDYKGIIANSFGGKPMKVGDLDKFFEQNVFKVCDINCEYGIDEIVLGFYMYSYMKQSLYEAGVNLNVYGISTVPCSTYENLASCYMFANLCGVVSFFTNYFYEKNTDLFLNQNEVSNVILCYYVLVINYVSTRDFKSFSDLSVVPIKFLQNYNKFLTDRFCFRLVEYLVGKYGEKTHTDILNTCFIKQVSRLATIKKSLEETKKDIFDVFCHSMPIVTPNPSSYSKYYLSEYDINVQSSIQSQPYDSRYLSYIKFKDVIVGVVDVIGSDSFIGKVIENDQLFVYKYRSHHSIGYGHGFGLPQKYSTVSTQELLELKDILSNKIYKNNFQQLVGIHDMKKYKNSQPETYQSRNFYIVYEYVDGSTIEELIESGGITVDMIELIFPVLLKLCNHLHGNNWIHGDIHEGNIVIDNTGNIVLIDFDKALPSAKFTSVGKYPFPYTKNTNVIVGGYTQPIAGHDNETMNVTYDLFCVAKTLQAMIDSYNMNNKIHYLNHLYLDSVKFLLDVNYVINNVEKSKIELSRRFGF